MDALILGATPNSLSAARSLGRAGLRVTIAETKSVPAIERSRYVARFELLEVDDDAAIAGRLMELATPEVKPFLFPTGDRFALLVAKHCDLLRERYCFVVPDYARLEAIVDKAMLYELARHNDIPHPGFAIVESLADIDAAVAGVATPCYAKPALGHEWRRFRNSKLERADSSSELRTVLTTFIENGLRAVPQEIIPGPDSEIFSLSAYVDRAGTCRGWRTSRKLRQYPLNVGDGCLQETCEQPEVAELGLRLLALAGHRGPATVEFRRDPRTHRFVLIEINARTVLGQEMVARSGLDVAWMACCDARGEPIPAPGPVRHVRWINLAADYRAFRALRRDGRLTTLQWLRSIAACRAFALFALDDLRPWLFESRAWLVRVAGRLRVRWSSSHDAGQASASSS